MSMALWMLWTGIIDGWGQWESVKATCTEQSRQHRSAYTFSFAHIYLPHIYLPVSYRDNRVYSIALSMPSQNKGANRLLCHLYSDRHIAST